MYPANHYNAYLGVTYAQYCQQYIITFRANCHNVIARSWSDQQVVQDNIISIDNFFNNSCASASEVALARVNNLH